MMASSIFFIQRTPLPHKKIPVLLKPYTLKKFIDSGSLLAKYHLAEIGKPVISQRPE